MAAILDLTSHPLILRYTFHNLIAVLHKLRPRPLVFITGAAFSPEMFAESIMIWNSYMKATKEEGTLVIDVGSVSVSSTNMKYVESLNQRL